MAKPTDIDERELRRRVLYALVRPVASMAAAFRIPLSEVVGAAQLAYFDHHRQRGLKLREIGERLAISERSAKRLAKQLRENFLDAERRYDLPVRVEFMLWATPMSRTKLKQVLSTEASDVDDAVDQLLAEGRIVERAGRTPVLEVDNSVTTLVRDTWLARIGGLNSFLSNLSDAVFGRFFKGEPKAFARTMSFLLREQDLPELHRLFVESFIPTAQKVDEQAKAAGDGERFRVSLCWAPYDYLSANADDPPDGEDGEHP